MKKAKTIVSQGQQVLVAALKAARKDAGLSQQELADRLRLQQSFIARTESGGRRIDLRELVIYCRAMGADPHSILKQVADATPDDELIG
ncbi:helix-turn-helix domain-containing protein [Cochlodiniinecator piscidefendens]|uniref:helix-turn-helix domain-containing protein n=1 Tax=Cochlodiniinecator piscidefendens TaxID=2715756 RepID=UPI0014089D05|nr:helix-turn-helix transcriptional regulator [Cochlodiniinecator piscidefendens]